MSATYVAWNGQSYPWPPPEGWYLASDGQWWAPGTGPNPPTPAAPAEQPQSPPAETLSPDQQSRPDHQSDPVQDQTGAPANPSPIPQQPAQAEPVAATVAPIQEQSDGHHTRVVEPPVGNSFNPTPPNNLAGVPAGGAIWQQPSQRPGRGLQKGLLIGFGAFIALVAIGFITIILTSDDDSTDIANADDPPDEITTTAAVSPTTTIVEPVTTTTFATTTLPPTTTVAESTTTTVVSEAAQVAAFRARLDEDDLSADELTDEDIVQFGTSFCIFATIADDAEAFDAFRQQAIQESDGNLTTDELNLAIDDAIIVFCPEEAARLGIT